MLVHRLPTGTILNLGAGTTGHSGPHRTVINVDHVPPPVRGAGQFVLGDALVLPFQDGCFDGLLMKDVLEHLPDPIAALREMRRVAVPGAILVLTTPRAVARAVWDDPTHLRGFTSRALLTALAKGGWRPVKGLRRLGGLPGAGRLHLETHLEHVMRIPGLGHWFGTNWIAQAMTSEGQR